MTVRTDAWANYLTCNKQQHVCTSIPEYNSYLTEGCRQIVPKCRAALKHLDLLLLRDDPEEQQVPCPPPPHPPGAAAPMLPRALCRPPPANSPSVRSHAPSTLPH